MQPEGGQQKGGATMRVTGYMLMDRIEELQEQARTLENQFKTALFRFPNESEEKPDPRVLMADYQTCQEQLSRLQEAQAEYNLRVQVTAGAETMSLQRAVKLIGSAAHIKNQWKTAAQDEEVNRYFGPTPRQRDKDAEYAVRVVSVEECLRLTETASRLAKALKQAIRSGNATEMELDIAESAFA
jgi:hypothetical protein